MTISSSLAHDVALCGRADLLRALARGMLPEMAELLEYSFRPRVEEPDSISFPGSEPGAEKAPPTQTSAGPPAAPARFWRLERVEPVEASSDGDDVDNQSERPEFVKAARVKAGSEVTGKRKVLPDEPPTPPLGSFADLLPSLRPAAAGLQPSRAPDVRALVRRVARGEAPRRIPRLLRRRWGTAVRLMIDPSARLIPYGQDFRRLKDDLVALFPSGALEPIDAYRPWRDEIPPPGTAIIALGDLGSLATAPEGLMDAWNALGRELALAGCRPVAVLPAAPDVSLEALSRWWSLAAWEPLGAGPGDASAREHLEELITVTAPAASVEPGLIRSLRLAAFRRTPGAAVEAAFWQSDYLASPHSVAAEPEIARRHEALAAFARLGVEQRQAALRVLEDWRRARREVWYEEILGLDEASKSLLATGDLDEATEWFLWKGTDLQREDREVDGSLSWFMNLAARFPTEAWMPESQGEGASTDGPPAWKERWHRAWVRAWNASHKAIEATPPPGYDPGLLPRKRDQPRRCYALRQEGDQIVALAEAASAPGSPLATIEARYHELAIEAISDFWNTGVPPAWADVWSCDEIGPWAEFSVPDAQGEPVTQRLRWMPAGTFQMGSPDDEPERAVNEEPRHEVTLSRGFWMFDTACRQVLWRAVMGGNPSRFRGDDRPVETVSWNDAMDFIQRLDALKQGLGLALPSEAEWEYAARAQTDGPFSFGANIDPSLVNYDGGFPYAGAAKGLNRGETVPVASLPNNDFGLYEMHGNVWEWCEDVYHDDYQGAPSDGSARLDGVDEPGAKRVLRGGSWDDRARRCRSAARSWGDPGGRGGNVGFRPVARVQVHGRAEPGGSRRIRPAERRIAASLSGGAARGRLVAGGPEARLDLTPGAPFVIRSDCEHLTFGLTERPEWATAIGRDKYGLWTRFEVKGGGGGTVSQRMRWIPPGRFTMGSPADEPGRFDNEGPAHEVTISSGFWLFDTPLTQAMWRAVMKNNPSEFKSPDRPVDNVSWNDCKAFIAAAAGLDGFPEMALPTEAEWEYSCRAGTRTALHCGPISIQGVNNAPALDSIAWYGGNSGRDFDLKKGFNSRRWPDKQYDHKQAGTRLVGRKAANGWGLYDMIGNVWEWCDDGVRDYDERAVVDPLGSTEGGAGRVLRGGSWDGHARFCRSAARSWEAPDGRDDNIGFRPVARVQA